MAEPFTAAQRAAIDALVAHYAKNRTIIERLTQNLHFLFTDHELLQRYVHSIRVRVKEPDHLRDKLERKMREALCEGKPLDITPENLFERINDLSGIRILHLHTRQMADIDQALKAILEDNRYPIVEPPIARTWDDESREYFKQIGIATVPSERMYTSVHYVIATNTVGNKSTAEIQVRTLAEELWGEVDHTLNYPHPTTVLACSEQIKVLARVTSSCSRLVDSIFRTAADHETPAATARKAAPPADVALNDEAQTVAVPTPDSQVAAVPKDRARARASSGSTVGGYPARTKRRRHPKARSPRR